MIKPPRSHKSRYRNSGTGDVTDGRLFAPTFQRNSPPMIAQLAPWMVGRSGPVLEIGAGTGQHAAAFALAFPDLDWWPSDPDEMHRTSTTAWQREVRAPDRPAFNIDAAGDWGNTTEITRLGPLTAILSMNVIHISPFDVARGIVAGAGTTLGTDGILAFYGPFKEDGLHTGDGNKAFDAGLRGENPEWGIRDVAEINDLAMQHSLEQAALIQMPANNRLLIFRKG